jgi:protocatechuate 3,4-dioxygenase beta subunit
LFKTQRAFPGAFVSSLVLLSALNAHVYAQASQPAGAAVQSDSIPDAPQLQADGAQQPPASAQQPAAAEPTGTGTISGTILDTNGNVVQGARVALRRHSGANAEIMPTGSGGQFTFNGLPPGPYKLTVTGNAMSTYASPEIELKAGEVKILPSITLSVTTESSVTVTADTEQIAEEQVQIAIQQRVLGVIPNFYMTFDWNAPPMMAKQKFKLSLRATFDPTAFAIMAGVAGAEQYKDVFPGFGGGLEGYGKRYGATFANHVTDQFFGRAIYPSIFHQDPRYFYKGKGSITSRALYAMSATVIARGDDGRWKPNYSNVLGKFTSGAISNLYYPASERGAGLVFFNGLTELGSDAVDNLIKEFLLKNVTSHVPKGANGEP